jgi:RecJ-like exonuclease|tara:strand:+ start:35 stop:211 length:177 start_codon:yes stop_codon:yes gene_type:complete
MIYYIECPLCLGIGSIQAELPIAEHKNGHDRSQLLIECPKCEGSGEINVEGGKGENYD